MGCFVFITHPSNDRLPGAGEIAQYLASWLIHHKARVFNGGHISCRRQTFSDDVPGLFAIADSDLTPLCICLLRVCFQAYLDRCDDRSITPDSREKDEQVLLLSGKETMVTGRAFR